MNDHSAPQSKIRGVRPGRVNVPAISKVHICRDILHSVSTKFCSNSQGKTHWEISREGAGGSHGVSYTSRPELFCYSAAGVLLILVIGTTFETPIMCVYNVAGFITCNPVTKTRGPLVDVPTTRECQKFCHQSFCSNSTISLRQNNHEILSIMPDRSNSIGNGITFTLTKFARCVNSRK